MKTIIEDPSIFSHLREDGRLVVSCGDVFPDGDHVMLVVSNEGEGVFKVSDCGMSSLRGGYNVDISGEKINNCEGEIFSLVSESELKETILNLSSSVGGLTGVK